MLPACDSCGQPLELVDLAAGAPEGFATPPVLSVALGGTLRRFSRLTVTLFEAWRLVVGVILGAMVYFEPMTPRAAQQSAPNGWWMLVWVVVCWYLLTWPMSRALRRRAAQGASNG